MPQQADKDTAKDNQAQLNISWQHHSNTPTLALMSMLVHKGACGSLC
jgi:hypothetical protein